MTYYRPPALWLTPEQARRLKSNLDRADMEAAGEEVNRLILDATEVPERPHEVDTTLFGELLDLLKRRDIVTSPKRWPLLGGRVTLIDREEATDIEPSLAEFAKRATDALLTEEAYLTLILYADRPELVREAIRYFIKGLRLPSDRESLLLISN